MIVKNDPKLLAYRTERNPAKKRRLADQLCRENTPLVHKLVGKFARFAPEGVEMDDLIQAGYIGLLYTLDNIDMSKTFSTYMAFRVWHEVSKVIEKAGVIYHPRGSGMPYKVLKKIEHFQTQHGRMPTAAELGVKQEVMDRWAEMPVTASLEDHQEEGYATPDVSPNPEEQISAMETTLALDLEDLPEGQAKVLDALFNRGLTPQQAATELKLPLAWLEDTLEAGLENLRENLD